MSTKRDTYLKIKEVLEGVPAVKHVRLFNNQYTNIAREKPFPFPAVFIQFLELDYTTRGDLTQDGLTRARLHIGYDSLKTEDLAVFDLLDDIHKALQGLELVNVFTPLDRVHEEQDVDHDIISVWLVDYAFKIRDFSGSRNSKLVAANPQDVSIAINAGKPWLKQN